jgi:hypothetical protein
MEIVDLVNSISKSLPISFGSEDANNYIQYVQAACIENYHHEKISVLILSVSSSLYVLYLQRTMAGQSLQRVWFRK